MNYLPDDDLDQIVGGFSPMTIRRINGIKPPLAERNAIARAGTGVTQVPPINATNSAVPKIASAGAIANERSFGFRRKKGKQLL
ncbi:hypothetical protein [Legionella quateirensis]|uniref:Uncharacterized protein n=1 Tax=Legionella quateirensis TaxID=45072 RepID=A0A378KVQ9_9GAMM|nr:hypothetical protein [Legionella quateirensis]KTD51082.1 hypothetical protein Lqua_1309 [Legionella quateirensis]STY17671.1 Uncharacterised protein [Legionella quateirensis]